MPDLFPHLETLALSHNDFRHLPPSIVLFKHLRRVRTHGNKLSKGHSRRIGTRHNVREIQQLIQQKRDRGAVASDAAVPALTALAARQAQIFQRSGSANKNVELPPHLERIVSLSFECYGCRAFVLADDDRYLPPLFERVHHLDPGVALPTLIGYSASTEGHSTNGSSRTGGSKPPHLLTLEERVLLALIGRGLDLTTFVIGGEGYQFCLPCATSHLALDQNSCACRVCAEERRVKGDERGSDGDSIMRWLRRKPLRRLG